MAATRRRYDPDFRAGAIRIVTETGKSCAEVARELRINETTLATWVSRERAAQRQAQASGLGESEAAELARSRGLRGSSGSRVVGWITAGQQACGRGSAARSARRS